MLVATSGLVASAQPAGQPRLELVMWLSGLGVVGITFSAGRVRKRHLVMLIALVLLVVVANGCGGGHSARPSLAGTPAGTYNIAVNAVSSSVTHSTTVQLTVD
jgi:hypothetical protein